VRDDELTRLLADASPISEAEVGGFDFEQAEAELMKEITGSPALSDVADLDTARQGRLRRHLTRGRGVAALAGAATVAAVTVIGIGSLGGDDHPAFAAGAIRIAEENPRLLVTEPGWSVTRADEFTADSGEMTFSNGEDELELFWRPAGNYESSLGGRAREVSSTKIQLLGRPATLFSFDGYLTTLLPPQGRTFVEIRADDPVTEETYLELLGSLRPADVETWLAAMPASVVRPIDRAAAVDEMLEGIPLPPGFDAAALRSGDTVSDRYQLGAEVTGAVACTWLDRWTAAIAAGDTAGAAEAKQAMATARSWPILREMNAHGDYPEVLWDWAEDRRGASGFGPNTSRDYNSALGCNTR
jgi:hypothetical protein